LERALAWYSSLHGLYSEFPLIFTWQIFSPGKVIFAGVGVLLLVRIYLNIIALAIVTPISLRQPRVFRKAKILSLTSFNG
jgi:hypothetical protein